MIDIDVEIIKESNMAFFVSDGNNTSWVPKSIIEYDKEINEIQIKDVTTIRIPEWFALKNDLI